MENKDWRQIDYGVFLKKDKFFRYRLIYPLKYPNGKMNWFNFWTGGSWGNLAMVTIICLLVIGSVLAYRHDIKACADSLNYAIENPCEWCEYVRANVAMGGGGLQLENFTLIKEEINSGG